jgi:hypothetical protein
VKAIVEKILRSGLVEKHTAELMERWGTLPSGAADVVPTGVTQDQLLKFAEEITEEMEKEDQLRETNLDLNLLRWPTDVTILKTVPGSVLIEQLAYKIPAVIDRMGHLFFRIQDVQEEWFVPGYIIYRTATSPVGYPGTSREVILNKEILYLGSSKVCIQVETAPFTPPKLEKTNAAIESGRGTGGDRGEE